MTLEKTLIRRVVLLGAFALSIFTVFTRLVAAPTPSPALLVTIQGQGEQGLQIADPLTMKVVASVRLEGNPHDVAVSDDGKLAFVTCSNSGWRPGVSDEELLDQGNQYISVIDLVAQKELRRVETGTGSWPHGIIFAGGKVYFTAEGYSLVGRYDPASDRIDWMMGTGQNKTHGLVITNDFNKIFAVNVNSASATAIMAWSAQARIIDGYPHAPWEATMIPIGRVPLGIDMSRDEREVWVSNKVDDTVSIIDVATLKVSHTISLNLESPIRLQFTPDGKRVIIPAENSGEVLILDAATRKEIKRITLGEKEEYELVNGEAVRNGVEIETKNKIQNLVIAPDGSRAYLTNSGRNRLAIIDLKTFELTGSIPVGTSPESVAWVEKR